MIRILEREGSDVLLEMQKFSTPSVRIEYSASELDGEVTITAKVYTAFTLMPVKYASELLNSWILQHKPANRVQRGGDAARLFVGTKEEYCTGLLKIVVMLQESRSFFEPPVPR